MLRVDRSDERDGGRTKRQLGRDGVLIERLVRVDVPAVLNHDSDDTFHEISIALVDNAGDRGLRQGIDTGAESDLSEE